MLVRLLENAGKSKKGTTTSITLTSARARYTVSAKWKGDWLNFAVDAFVAFENVGGDVMDRTV